MGTTPDALYFRLLEDVSSILSADQIAFVQSGGADWPDITIRQAAANSIVRSFLRKLEPDSSDVLNSRALVKFLHCNKLCGEWEVPEADSTVQDILLGEFRRAVFNFWNPDKIGLKPIYDHDYDALFRGRCGPGSAIGSRGGDFYTKMFASPLACTTSYLYTLYRRYVFNFPEWANAENIRQAHFGDAHIVKGNRLSFVPKNRDISRVICVEPSVNMFYQLGFGSILEQRLLEAYGINLATQQLKNRELARQASIFDHLVTIDLSSASDTISLKMLEWALPPDFFRVLKRLRSPLCEIPGMGYQPLNMISTMGNGFTFPLQTMLFSCVVLAAYAAHGVEPRYPRGQCHGDFGVNGDDIICPKEISRSVMWLLKALGFSVNASKTFVEGPFRESCGGDFFRGVNIRGFYLIRLKSLQDHFVAINQLNLFSTRTGVTVPRTMDLLLRNTRWQPVPFWENDDAGIKVPSTMVRLKVDPALQSVIYHASVQRSSKIRITDSAVFCPKGSRPRIYNPSGLYMSFLQRSINAFTIPVRHDEVRYERKRRVAPSWDALCASNWTPSGSAVRVYTRFAWQRWNTAVYLNLLVG